MRLEVREATCTRKMAYERRALAKADLLRLKAQGRHVARLRAFHCTNCGWWHLGAPPVHLVTEPLDGRDIPTPKQLRERITLRTGRVVITGTKFYMDRLAASR
jgi:hypothetical protein